MAWIGPELRFHHSPGFFPQGTAKTSASPPSVAATLCMEPRTDIATSELDKRELHPMETQSQDPLPALCTKVHHFFT